jgi:hypothetical protein
METRDRRTPARRPLGSSPVWALDGRRCRKRQSDFKGSESPPQPHGGAVLELARGGLDVLSEPKPVLCDLEPPIHVRARKGAVRSLAAFFRLPAKFLSPFGYHRVRYRTSSFRFYRPRLSGPPLMVRKPLFDLG